VLLILHLAIVTLGIGLPGLIKGLEVEEINTPVEHTTDTSLPELLSILGTGLGILVVRTAIVGQPVSPVTMLILSALSPAIF
jgi:hypothetical protein